MHILMKKLSDKIHGYPTADEMEGQEEGKKWGPLYFWLLFKEEAEHGRSLYISRHK